MPLLDITDPRVIALLLESYEKERILRMKWVDSHKERIQQAATLTREPTNYCLNDISRSVMVAGMASLTKDHAVAARNRKMKLDKDYMLAKVSVAKPLQPPMMPLKKEVKDLLQESSKEYLKVRKTLAPEDKYNYIDCSNWRFGWKLGESGLKMRGSEYGKVSYMTRELRCRVGAQPNPEYYGTPQTVPFCDN